MKRLFAILVAVAVAMCSCSKIFDTSVLERNIVELKDRVTALEEQCKQMNTNISSLQTIVTALQNNDYVTGVAPITQNGVEIGYTISFSKSGSITIYHGKDGSNGLDGSDGSDGSDGASGSTPVVGVKQDTDGVYYWTLNGEWLLNDSGEKVKAISTDGKDGEDGQDGTNGKDGKDGITPQLKIENGYWYVSYNNGESWESLGKATGDNGQDGANGADGAAGSDGDSFFQSVTQDENNVIFTLADGTVITVPKSSSYLFNKLQSVSYVPKFSDGKATVYYSAASNSQVEMDFEVSPKDAVEDIAAQWETILSLKAVNTQTRAVTYIDMPISGCTADAQHGVITVTASGKNLAANFFSGEQTVSARLGISDGNTNITSEYIELFAAPAVEPFSNEIWYTSTDGNIVEPCDKAVFGANIISNTYKNGKGVITFDGEVTEIGNRMSNRAFYFCDNLTSITIPDSVTQIRDEAFNGCSNLSEFNGKFATSDKKAIIVNNVLIAYAVGCVDTEYTISDGVTKIGNYAFQSCSSLTSITIPNSVTEIGNNAFQGCHCLRSITIPDSVTKIGANPFEYCHNLSEFKGKFAAEDGRCLIVDRVLKSFARAGLTEYTIPDDITKIGDNTFSFCYSLTSITIPNSVTEIGYQAFEYCESLTSITIPDSVTKIGNYAFSHCSGLTSVTIPNSVTEIRIYAFSWCSHLTSVFCKRTTPPTAYLGGSSYWSAFNDNAADRKIYVPAESVDAYKTADGWKEYADAIVADPATLPATNEILYTSTDGNIVEPYDKTVFGANIVSNTYENGKGVITFDGEVTEIGYDAFRDCDSLTSVTIPDSVTEIGDWAFSFCESLTSVTIPDSVTEIGYGAFMYCNGLTNVTIPDSVTSIGSNPFMECNNLSEFKGKFAADNGRCLIVDGILKSFAPAGLTEYTIPDSVTEIGNHAFEYCSGLTSITIPNSVTEFEDNPFRRCNNLSEFKGKFAADNGRCLIVDGILNSFAPAGITTYNIPDGITKIGDWAFYWCDGLTSITIPNSVTQIGVYAFGDCAGLTSVFCERTTPPTAYNGDSWNAFSGNAADRKIYVPAESVDAYKEAGGWKEYADSIEPYDFLAVSE